MSMDLKAPSNEVSAFLQSALEAGDDWSPWFPFLDWLKERGYAAEAMFVEFQMTASKPSLQLSVISETTHLRWSVRVPTKGGTWTRDRWSGGNRKGKVVEPNLYDLYARSFKFWRSFYLSTSDAVEP